MICCCLSSVLLPSSCVATSSSLTLNTLRTGGRGTLGALLFSLFVVYVVLLRRRSHFLLVLLALELLVVVLIVLLVIIGLYEGVRAERLLFVLLVGGVCESCLGLALLVTIVRAFGRDLIRPVRVHQV